MQTKTKEFLGFIIKKDKFGSLEASFDYNEMILEDMDPFPGYYHVVPGDMKGNKPKFVFFLIKPFKQWNTEKIIRKTIEIKENCKYYFDASPGELMIFNRTRSCIRICVRDYNFVKGICDAYKNSGIEFMKKQRVKPFHSLIKVLKYFELEEIDDGIYHDRDDPDMYYIQLPGELNWDTFEEITLLIKNNIDYKNFDAALASFYGKTGIKDYARIYCKMDQYGILGTLKKAYFKEINRRL